MDDSGRDGRTLHWDRIHGETPPEATSWHEVRPTASLELIERARLAPGAAILDVGAGTSPLVDCLLEQGYRALRILDVSGSALERVHARVGALGQFVEFFETDVANFESPPGWDLWHDRAVLHSFTDAEDREAYRARLLDSLRPGGQVVVATFGPDGPRRCSGLECRRYSSTEISAFFGSGFRLWDHRVHDHRTPSGAVQQFLHARLQLRG